MQTQSLSATARAANITDMTEEELISLGQGGNSTAVGELFRRHHQQSLRVARRILSSTEDSEDAVQDAYCSVLQHIGSFRGDASFGTWLTRIVVNSCHMTFRQPFRRLLPISTESADTLANLTREPLERSPENCASRRELAATLYAAIARLPPELHERYTLYSYSEMPVAEVAAVLGLTLPAAKTRIYRARAVLRTALDRAWRLGRPIAAIRRDHQSAASTVSTGWQPGPRTAVHARHSSSQPRSGQNRWNMHEPLRAALVYTDDGRQTARF